MVRVCVSGREKSQRKTGRERKARVRRDFLSMADESTDFKTQKPNKTQKNHLCSAVVIIPEKGTDSNAEFSISNF